MTQINNYDQPAWMAGPPERHGPAPARKTRRRWPWITLGTIVAVIVIAVIAANGGNGGGAPVRAVPLATTPATSTAQQVVVAPATTAQES
jgi:hypothetical protein